MAATAAPAAPPELRACTLCTHHTWAHGDTRLHCAEPVVAGALGIVPCEVARYSDVGGCGRDATRMHWPPLEVPARRMPQVLWATAA
jgi:hypothetical protein